MATATPGTGLLLGVLALALTLLACGRGVEAPSVMYAEPAAGQPPQTGAPEPAREVIVEKEVVREVPVEVMKEVPKELRPYATPAPALPAAAKGAVGVASKIQASMVAQERIIVHTGDMSLVVGDIAAAIDQVAGLAAKHRGWVVSTNRASRHSGQASIRIPAASLLQVLRELEDLAIDVKSRSLTSQDVTDEFVDTQSRLKSLRASEQVHLDMLSNARNVEEALMVQDRISAIQSDIEALQGRINYLSEIAAFSLVNVQLELATALMPVDAGPDTAFKVAQNAQFRANFTPPAGIDDFQFIWDFGDGSQQEGGRTAPVASQQGERITAPVTHQYETEGEYIAEITLKGTGGAGLVEGSDTILVTVTQVPTIEVFAGESMTVEEDQELNLRATFTRPEELWDYQYKWDFGDGTPTETGNPPEGSTIVNTSHQFADFRPRPYTVTFTMSAMSDAGKVISSGGFDVRITESRGFIIGGWSAGDTGKTAVRTLSVVVQALATFVIWLAVFSPVLLLLAAVVIGLVFLRRRFGMRSRPLQDPQPPEDHSST